MNCLIWVEQRSLIVISSQQRRLQQLHQQQILISPFYTHHSSFNRQLMVRSFVLKLSMQKLALVWVLFSKGSLCTMFKTLNYYSLNFDKSLNRVTQSAEKDFMVRYLDHSDYLVKTRYATSKFLAHARHNDLYQTFCPLLKG